ncbi:ATP-binding protein [Nodularia sp. UHCC 0506]|uniref:ATP-binding protein n=1 Tax=Nodularia sp. UHCC 0506 TaxID=3110243 RepID=UPI002B1F6556|nr:ATP-binding protein [Nodularia sp. UHCC 0506]MEA5513457.1 ATP-binding protein [Nodularia sp. UHCC 0506]
MLSKLQFVKLLNCLISKIPAKVQLRSILILPFVLQIVGLIGFVGYQSLQNGQQSLKKQTIQLETEICDRIEQHLNSYLNIFQQINQISHSNFNISKGELIGVENLNNYKLLRSKIFANRDIGQIHIETTNNQENLFHFKTVNNDHPPLKYGDENIIELSNPFWSQISSWQEQPDILSISANYFIDDPKSPLVGMIGVDLILPQIDIFLSNLEEIGRLGKAFILERSGLMVASSTTDLTGNIHDGQASHLLASQSQDYLIRLTNRHIIERFGSWRLLVGHQHFQFMEAGTRYFVQIDSWQNNIGLDWVIVVVIPEAEFNTKINHNFFIIIILSVVTLLIVAEICFLIERWIIKPIVQLNIATKKIAAGEFPPSISIQRCEELGEIAKSFNSMAEQLQKSLTTLELQRTEIEVLNKELSVSRSQLNQLQTTQQKLIQSQQISQQENHAKSEFLANMSHELRTPLNAILGFTQIMSYDYSLSSEHQQNLSIINRAGEHLLNLINDILELSKVEAGKTTLNISSFDLVRLLDGLQEMFRFRAVSKGLQLIFEYTPNLPQYVRTDESKLRQVLVNLLENAFKFTKIGSITLRVSLGIEDQNIREQKEHRDITSSSSLIFEVTDTGAGISPEEIKLIFEAFRQTESGKKSQEGTGLGLAISRKYVQMMGGNITVSSILEIGSKFTFDIQIAPGLSSEIPIQQPQHQVVALAPEQQLYRIMVVDDVLESRLVVVKLLSSIGFIVREAANGQEAIALWMEWQPHLIFMDMRMPIMDGYEATRIIKASVTARGMKKTFKTDHHKWQKLSPQLATHPNIETGYNCGQNRKLHGGYNSSCTYKSAKLNTIPPGKETQQQQRIPQTHTVIIALTASAFEEERQEILSAGCDDFIRKPFTREVLLDKVRQYLSVKYISQAEITKTAGVDPEQQILLNETEIIRHLSQMPPIWLKNINQAAAICSDDLILELLQELPPDKSQVFRLFRDLASEYQFEKIMELTRTKAE